MARPPLLDWAEAATLPDAGQSAHCALSALHLQRGETLLIHGAAGGVGSMAVQLARLAGARVTAGIADTVGAARLLDAERRALTLGMVALIGLGAFEALAVTTAMPAAWPSARPLPPASSAPRSAGRGAIAADRCR